jgi:basic membrane lipoprotein Med (substrate-binding protein (PBP1-ABC) superfamily)
LADDISWITQLIAEDVMKQMGAIKRSTIAASFLLMSTNIAYSSSELHVAMLLPGQIDDNGFMEAGYNGLLRIEEEFAAKIEYIDGIQPVREDLEAALRKLAEQSPDMVIAHGGQNNEAAATVAAEFPMSGSWWCRATSRVRTCRATKCCRKRAPGSAELPPVS